MDKLKQLIEDWKGEAAEVESDIKREIEPMIKYAAKADLWRLKKCIRDAELLLKTDTGAST